MRTEDAGSVRLPSRISTNSPEQTRSAARSFGQLRLWSDCFCITSAILFGGAALIRDEKARRYFAGLLIRCGRLLERSAKALERDLFVEAVVHAAATD